MAVAVQFEAMYRRQASRDIGHRSWDDLGRWQTVPVTKPAATPEYNTNASVDL
jgi:hypothetical protein